MLENTADSSSICKSTNVDNCAALAVLATTAAASDSSRLCGRYFGVEKQRIERIAVATPIWHLTRRWHTWHGNWLCPTLACFHWDWQRPAVFVQMRLHLRRCQTVQWHPRCIRF